MPKFNITDAYKEALASAPSNLVILRTIELYQEDLDEHLYFVSDRVNHTCTLEDESVVEFVAYGFDLKLPSAGSEGIQSLSLSVDNADRQASDFFKSCLPFTNPVVVTYRPYLANDLTTPQMNPPLVLFLSDVKIDLTRVSAKATFADLLNKPFLSQGYTQRRFPGL